MGLGGAVGGRGGAAPAPVGPVRKPVTVTVTHAVGREGRAAGWSAIDHFIVTLALDDGTLRSFRRNGDAPKVEIQDPLAGHKALLERATPTRTCTT